MKALNNMLIFYKKMSTVGKVLLFVALLLILVVFFNSPEFNITKEGYEQNDSFVFKKGAEIYDGFYASIYDHLVFNNLKDDYEIGQILNKTTPSSVSVVLDVGSGTGHHVAKMVEKGVKASGIDNSQAMIQQAKEKYPQYDFKLGDVLDINQYQNNSFTHILCLYFTIYYFKNKETFFNNCMEWLMPGGYLVLHLVEREKFDPILPPGNPLYIVSPQKYAKERITHTKITFNNFVYTSNFKLEAEKDMATFEEKFKFNDGKVRKQEHLFYMEDSQDILTKAADAGFIVQGKIDLVRCAYPNQYLYILVKPS
jgi:ubiquinone/menaquinone biosynthesis C-methylase UbiE